MTCNGSRIIPLQFSSKRFHLTFQLAPVYVPISELISYTINISSLTLIEVPYLNLGILYHRWILVHRLRNTRFSSPSQPVVYSSRYQGFIAQVLWCSLLRRASSIRTPLRHPPPHHHQPWPSCFCQTLLFGPWEACLHQSRILHHEERGYYSSFQFTMEFSCTHDEEERWWLVPLWRLPAFKHHHRYPLPNVTDCTSRISSSTVFSKLDLHKGYYQVPMCEDDILKTMFWYIQILCLPFCRKHFPKDDGSNPWGPSVFFCICWWYPGLQSWSLHSCTPSLPGVWAAPSSGSHHQPSQVRICCFQTQVPHHLSSSGCSPLDKYNSAISPFPPPSYKPALQRFLGMINFYRKFIKKAALILATLTKALKCPGKLLDWTPTLLLLSAVLKTFSPLCLFLCFPSLVLLSP